MYTICIFDDGDQWGITKNGLRLIEICHWIIEGIRYVRATWRDGSATSLSPARFLPHEQLVRKSNREDSQAHGPGNGNLIPDPLPKKSNFADLSMTAILVSVVPLRKCSAQPLCLYVVPEQITLTKFDCPHDLS